MKILNRMQYQRGVGLLEVLIALVVIMVGVTAVLGLQGTLMSGSATSKARNEARTLTLEKTEELRNAVELGQFDKAMSLDGLTPDPENNSDPDKEYYLDPDLDPEGKINGVNAQFTRRWNIVDTDNALLKELVMQVTWTDAQDVYNKVELNTLIAYASPLTSTLSQQDADPALLPGELDTGYEGLHDDTPRDEPDADLDDLALEEDGDYGITDIYRYSNGHVQVRIWDEFCAEHDQIRDSDGKPILNPDNESEKLCVAFTAFGGTLLRFDGTVYLDFKKNTLDDVLFLVKATSPAYCAQKTEMTCGEMQCVEFQCYVSGDCSKAGGVGCPDNWSDLADSGVLPNLNGGWYGKIGHFFYDNTAAYKDPPASIACMGKERVDDAGSDPVDNKTISRSYYGLRSEASPSTLKWREGINQSYSCHNTLFVEFNAAGEVCNDGYDKMITGGIVWNSFKDDKVIRELAAGDVNNVLDADRVYCDLVAIYGSVFLPDDLPIELGAEPGDITATPAGKTTFNTVIADPRGGSEPGECVTQVSPKGDIIYACNFIDDQWSGYIIASADPRPYDVTTTYPDGTSTTSEESFTCEGSLYYAPEIPATGRNPGQELSIVCYP